MKLHNLGLGTGIIKSLTLIDRASKDQFSIENFINRLLPLLENDRGRYQSLTFLGDTAVVAGSELPLLIIGVSPQFPGLHLTLQEFLGQYDLSIDYEDMYGKKFTHKNMVNSHEMKQTQRIAPQNP